MSLKAKKCPQCGHESLGLLPGAWRKSCSLCNYVEPETEAPDAIPFQGYAVDRTLYKRRKSLNLFPLLITALMLLGFYLTFQLLNQESEELTGLRGLERSYHKITRMITPASLQSPERRAKLRHQIQREKAVIRHLQVSPCLQNPRSYLSNLYTVFEKGLAKPKFNFKSSRRIISISSKFVNGTLECKEKFAPHQYSALQLYSDYPDSP